MQWNVCVRSPIELLDYIKEWIISEVYSNLIPDKSICIHRKLITLQRAINSSIQLKENATKQIY